MPDVKVYIRSEDLELWNKIEKKSEWMHNALNGRLKHLEKQLGRLEKKMVDDIVNTPKLVILPSIPKEEPFKTYFKNKSSKPSKQPTDDFQHFLKQKKKT